MRVLAYMAQQAVETHHWMTAPEMVDGLGLAETTPGPLILVTQFVGFLAAFRDAAPFSPIAAGVLGAAMTTWVTFVPSMLWIFAGAPFIEQLRANRRLVRRARRHHRRGGRRHPQPVGLVRAARAVRRGDGSGTRVRCAGTRSIRWRSICKPRRWPRWPRVLAFGLHRGLIEVVAVMAALGIAALTCRLLVNVSASRASALSCQRRSTRWESDDSAKKIAMPASDSSSSAANMRGMLSR